MLILLMAVAVISVVDDDCVYVENTKRFVGIIRGERILIGKLDASGNFIQDVKMAALRRNEILTSGPIHKVINSRYPGRETVYEFRASRLILGELDKEGNFIPKAGSTVIDFKDYRPGKDVPPIYNLPGEFVKAKKK